MKMAFSFLAGAAALLSAMTAQALVIENKSNYPAEVTLMTERFGTVAKFTVDARTQYEYLDENQKKEEFNIEAYIRDPADTIGIPTFLHLVKYKEKVCVPLDICTNEVKKKKKGGIFKIF